MKKINKILLLSLSILVMSLSCNEQCDDCLQLSTKSIKFVDSNGNNLLFGNQAIYDPDNLIITAGNNNVQDAWKQENTGTILFNLLPQYNVYYITLPSNLVDTLQFNLAERKSNKCCGNISYSTTTFLNGESIENSELITITK